MKVGLTQARLSRRSNRRSRPPLYLVMPNVLMQQTFWTRYFHLESVDIKLVAIAFGKVISHCRSFVKRRRPLASDSR
jgi:hypothetical protein